MRGLSSKGISKFTPLFFITISYIDCLIVEFVACCQVLMVSRGWAIKIPLAPVQIKIMLIVMHI